MPTMTNEQFRLLDAVNRKRERCGLPPVDSDAIALDGLPKERLTAKPEAAVTDLGGRTEEMDAWMCHNLAVAAFGDGVAPAYSEGADVGEWSGLLFPALSPAERRMAVRYAGAYGFLSDETPLEEGNADRTVVRRCLAYAGMSWVQLVGMKKREDRLAALVETAAEARKEAVMEALESRLQGRAFHGQKEQVAGRGGLAETFKYDNTLAFNLLKTGKGLGGKGAKGGKGEDDGGMTFVMAGGGSKPPEHGKK